MKSMIAERLKLKYSPVAIVFSEQKPEGAIEFTEGKWGCTISMLVAASKGRKAALSQKNFGCLGGGVALGFSKAESGLGHILADAQGLKKTAELGESLMESIPFFENPNSFVVFLPLEEAELLNEEPKIIVFFANPDQLTALTNLANYERPGSDNVRIPSAGGCQSICTFPLYEADQERPKATIGLLDITARKLVDANLLTFSVPYGMFREMEGNIQGSFLDKEEWNKLAVRI